MNSEVQEIFKKPPAAIAEAVAAAMRDAISAGCEGYEDAAEQCVNGLSDGFSKRIAASVVSHLALPSGEADNVAKVLQSRVKQIVDRGHFYFVLPVADETEIAKHVKGAADQFMGVLADWVHKEGEIPYV